MSKTRFWKIFWSLVVGLFLFAEGYAVGDPADGDTFSEFVWFLTENWWIEVPFFVLCCWLMYHFFVQPRLPKD